MGENFLSGKKPLPESLFVSFLRDLESNEPSEIRTKNTQLTSALRRVMAMACFNCKLAQLNTIKNHVLWGKKREHLKKVNSPFYKSLIANSIKLNQIAIKTGQSHYSPLCTCQLGGFGLPLIWLILTPGHAKKITKWHGKCIFPILIILTHTVKCQISYTFYCHCLSETGHFTTLWTLEHFFTLEMGEMYSRLVKCSVFLKI